MNKLRNRRAVLYSQLVQRRKWTLPYVKAIASSDTEQNRRNFQDAAKRYAEGKQDIKWYKKLMR